MAVFELPVDSDTLFRIVSAIPGQKVLEGLLYATQSLHESGGVAVRTVARFQRDGSIIINDKTSGGFCAPEPDLKGVVCGKMPDRIHLLEYAPVGFTRRFVSELTASRVLAGYNGFVATENWFRIEFLEVEDSEKPKSTIRVMRLSKGLKELADLCRSLGLREIESSMVMA